MREAERLRPRRRVAWTAAVALLAAATAMLSGLSGAAGAAGSGTFAMGIPTVVDPIRGVGEPIIAVDNADNAWISGPAGSSTQTSFFWHSRDGGLTYPMLGPPGGHWVCPSTGGGDSLLTYDRQNGDLYLTDQQALVSLATGKLAGGSGNLDSSNSKCFATPAMSADRPFEGVLHPSGASNAPQWAEDGHKPIVYMSWACQGCLGGNPTAGPGGLAFAWSDNGKDWHAADAGVPSDNLATNQFFEAPAFINFNWHGPTVVDQQTGYVFTGLSCSDSCPPGSTAHVPQFGIAVNKPATDPSKRADPSNKGQFASETYQTVADHVDGQPIPEPGSLFPIVAMDSAGTLYEAWVQGDGFADASKPPPATSWHVYYSYSKDKPDHKVWSPPIRVDSGPDTATSTMVWMTAGDAGKLGFFWLGTPTREHPSKMTATKEWRPFISVTTNGDTPSPAFQQSQIGMGPNHIGDICLQGTLCGATAPPGNRNMADFISVDIGPNGGLQATWANDANQVGTLPTALVKGVPLTETARQVSGPRLIGGGNVDDGRFSTAPTTAAMGDRQGDALYPVQGGTNVPQLDLTAARAEWDGSHLKVHLPAASLASLSSPDATQRNVWWIATWQYKGKVYFAKAESDAGGALKFVAGKPQSYDRPGLSYYTVPTLLDYRNGQTVSGQKVGDELVVDVPAAVVGNPQTGDVLEAFTGFTILDTGLNPFVTVGPGNIPTVVDATAAENALLQPVAGGAGGTGGTGTGGGASGGSRGLPATGRGPAVGLALAALVAAVVLGRRRRRARA